MNTDEKIAQVRQLMTNEGISAVIVPSDDPHKSEYVAEHWQARKWLTGFSGSAGTAVVTMEHAVLWTDFRYYIQAEKEISGSEFVLYKTGEPDVPGLEKWLGQTLQGGDTVGVDGRMFSANAMKKLQKTLDEKQITLNTGTDLAGELWTDRPPQPDSRAFIFPDKYAGETRAAKLIRIREKMTGFNAEYHLVTTLDDIAWILNLRGSDVHTNPVNIAFLLISGDDASLFMPETKADETIRAALEKDGVKILPYEEAAAALGKLPDGASVLVDPENVSYSLYEVIPSGCRIIEKPNPAIALKAIKNKTQINHLRQTVVRDGAAVASFLHWLEQQESSGELTEQSAAKAMYSFRKAQPQFVDNSFDPIMAWSDHSAMCHYSATDESDAAIGPEGMFLTDSGGNYLTGTTDITRTVYRGTPTPQAVRDYTLVLKGHISVARARFPKGAKGFQIDTLARQYLWNQGMDFGHGTGHGVGFFLCVHEGPARISPLPADVKLEAGMLLTNEPGVYRDGGHGIRLENMILVRQAFENTFGTFMEFENLTWCHFETGLIDKGLLTQEEVNWVNDYHASVYERLKEHLEPEVAAWLKEKTRPL